MNDPFTQLGLTLQHDFQDWLNLDEFGMDMDWVEQADPYSQIESDLIDDGQVSEAFLGWLDWLTSGFLPEEEERIAAFVLPELSEIASTQPSFPGLGGKTAGESHIAIAEERGFEPAPEVDFSPSPAAFKGMKELAAVLNQARSNGVDLVSESKPSTEILHNSQEAMVQEAMSQSSRSLHLKEADIQFQNLESSKRDFAGLAPTLNPGRGDAIDNMSKFSSADTSVDTLVDTLAETHFVSHSSSLLNPSLATGLIYDQQSSTQSSVLPHPASPCKGKEPDHDSDYKPDHEMLWKFPLPRGTATAGGSSRVYANSDTYKLDPSPVGNFEPQIFSESQTFSNAQSSTFIGSEGSPPSSNPSDTLLHKNQKPQKMERNAPLHPAQHPVLTEASPASAYPPVPQFQQQDPSKPIAQIRITLPNSIRLEPEAMPSTLSNHASLDLDTFLEALQQEINQDYDRYYGGE